MAGVSSFLAASSSLSAPQHNGPGSNGYMQRLIWDRSGSYTYVVRYTGWHKFDLVGAGSGGSGSVGTSAAKGGSGGGRTIKEIYLTLGDVVLITIGAGGAGSNDLAAAGGTTTVTCAARSLSLTCTGGAAGSTAAMAGGVGSGGDINLTGGGQPTGAQIRTGGAAAPSHIKNGGATVAYGRGGSGLGGASPDSTYAGASSHRKPVVYAKCGANGLTTKGGSMRGDSATTNTEAVHGESARFWDLSQIDGGGGGVSELSGEAGDGGAGAGGAGVLVSNAPAGNGGILGGGGYQDHTAGMGGHGGNGGGGGGTISSTLPGGNGGDGLLYLFFDELKPRAA